MSADPEPEYLTTRQVAERLGIKYLSVRTSLYRGLMPEPDMRVLGYNLWLKDTIENWQRDKRKRRKAKPGKRRKPKVPREARVKPVNQETLPRNVRISSDRKNKPVLKATIDGETASQVAALVRQEGHHCTTRDVEELHACDPSTLPYERLKLQQRVQRTLRGLA